MESLRPTLALVLAHVADFGARSLAALVSLPVFALGFFVLERFFRLTGEPRTRNAVDLEYFLLTPAFDLLTRSAGALCMAVIAVLVGQGVRPELLRGFGPVMHQPRALIMIEMLLLLELTAYSSHRLFHSVPFLWRFHAVHHSSKRLCWISAVRRHPLNDLATHCVNASVLVACGFPIDFAMTLLPVVGLHAFLTHADLDWRFGPFRRLVVSPIYHRFHHTLGAEGGHKNFAALFPIFDLLFGTYHLPPHAPCELGLDRDDVPENLVGQLAYPFMRPAQEPSLESASRYEA